LVDLRFDITIDANNLETSMTRLCKSNYKTYPILDIAKTNWEKNCTFLFSYLTIWFNET
jgi:hypothetical protein